MAAAPAFVQDWNKIAGVNTEYSVLKEGSGAAVAKGATVTVHATGVVWNEDEATCMFKRWVLHFIKRFHPRAAIRTSQIHEITTSTI